MVPANDRGNIDDVLEHRVCGVALRGSELWRWGSLRSRSNCQNRSRKDQSTHVRLPHEMSFATLRMPRAASSCSAVALGEIFGAAHFLEAADGTLELEAAVAGRV